jgi:hypothetical protein
VRKDTSFTPGHPSHPTRSSSFSSYRYVYSVCEHLLSCEQAKGVAAKYAIFTMSHWVIYAKK